MPILRIVPILAAGLRQWIGRPERGVAVIFRDGGLRRLNRGEGTGMPIPSLRGWLRSIGPIGLLCLPVWLPASVHAEDAVLDDQVVPAQFRRAKVEEPEDPFPYHGLTVIQAGTSATSFKRAAVAEVPLDKLKPEERQKAASVLKGLGLYRRLPTLSFEADPEVYAYFLKNPDVAVATWKAMGISRFALQQDQPGIYSADAGDGSRGTVEVFYSTPKDTLIYCEGAFKSPLLPKPIVAKSLMRLQVKFDKQADGRMVATHHGDVFVELPSQTVETVAKLISPVSNSIADRNFKQLTFYAHMMSIAMSRQPGWVEALARRMDEVPAERRDEFLRLSAATYVAARQREAAQHGQTISLEEILRPLRISEPAAPAPLAGGNSKSLPRIASQVPAAPSPK